MLFGYFLTLCGLAVAILYFWLFYGTFKRAGDEADRYGKTFSGYRKWTWIIPVLLLMALVVENAIAAIVLASIGFGLGAYATLAQNSRMRELGFSQTFRQRLLRISFLVPIAIAFYVAGQLWRNGHAI